jgi:hypothetical protein
MKALGLRLEDVALAGWNLAGVPLVAASALAPVLAFGGEPSAAAGTIQLLAVGGAIVAIATRPLGAPPPSALPSSEARLGFIAPLVGAITLVAGSASAHLEADFEGLVIGVAFIVTTAAMALGDRLPVLDAGLRRAFIFPFIAICAGIFNGFAADLLDDMDVGQLITAVTVDETGFGLFVIGMILAGLAAFYAMLVVAPRVLVTPEPWTGCLVWPARFVIYVVSAVLGIGWLAVLGA